MGKGSSLRVTSSEPEHLNGKGNGRKLVELDEMPEGCDSDIWHLTLYFVQKCEEFGVYASKTNGRPVVYEILKNRLTKANPSAIRARARSYGITVHWVSIVQTAIDTFFSNGFSSYYVIDEFTDVINFDNYINDAIAILERDKLIEEGTKIPQQDRPVLPSRRTEEQQKLHDIVTKKYTEEEQQDKMRDFRSRF